MSVVNQMLRDLQDQQQPANQLDLKPVAIKENILIQSKWFVGVLIVAIATFIWVKPFSSQSVSTSEHLDQEIDQAISHPKKETYIQAIKSGTEVLKTEVSKTGLASNIISDKANQIEQAKSSNLIESQESIAPNTSSVSAQTISDHTVSTHTISAQTPSNEGTKLETLTNKRNTDENIKAAELSNSESQLASKMIDKEKDEFLVTKVKKETLNSQLNRELNAILQAQSNRNKQQTIELLQQLVQEHPQFMPGHLNLIKTAWQANHPQLKSMIDTAIERHPKQPAFIIMNARFYLQNKEYALAEKAISQIDGTAPSETLLQTRALIFQKQNKHQLAINDYTLLLKRTKNKSSTYLALAISLEALGKNQQAKQSYQFALQAKQLNSLQTEFVKNKLAYIQG